MDKGIKIGWKVVFISDSGSLLSAMMVSFGVNYEIGKWVFPNISSGPLCVFENIGSANKFMHDYGFAYGGQLVAYKCEYEPSAYEFIWNTNGVMDRRVPIGDLPRGTRLARRVKLLEIVESQ